MSNIIQAYLIFPILNQARKISGLEEAEVKEPDLDPSAGGGIVIASSHANHSSPPAAIPAINQSVHCTGDNHHPDVSHHVAQSDHASSSLDTGSTDLTATDATAHSYSITPSSPRFPPITDSAIPSIPVANRYATHPDNRLPDARLDRWSHFVTYNFSELPVRRSIAGQTSDHLASLPSGHQRQVWHRRTRSSANLASDFYFQTLDTSSRSHRARSLPRTAVSAVYRPGDQPTALPFQHHAIMPSPQIWRTTERRLSRDDLPSPQMTSSPRMSRTNSSTGRIPRRQSSRNIPIFNEDGRKPSLPADDGMSDLRQKIHQIRELAISSEEKAQKMHMLMMQSWQAKGMSSKSQTPLANSTPVNRPLTPQSIHSTSSHEAISPFSIDSVEEKNLYNVTSSDLVASYRPQATLHPGTETPPGTPELDEDPDCELGCVHYKRNVKIQCFDCKKWYPCRHCHDEADPSHPLNRRKTENMLCMMCWTPQPAGQNCQECGMRAAHYYCDLCKLWDDDSTKRIYHCNDCGICRRGEGLGKDYVHCKRCNVCISIQHAATHRCIERATECDCPICGDYMFTSSQDIVAMPCGHYLHHTCYVEYIDRAYKCPVCCKSAVNMEVQWRKLESAIESQPMPTQLRDAKAEIKCNDCAARSIVSYHWLGNKCGTCDGYNTNEVRLIGTEETSTREVEDYAAGERRDAARNGDADLLAASSAAPTATLPVRPRTQLLQPQDYFAANFDEDDRRRRASHSGVTDEVERAGLSLANVNLPNFGLPYEMLARMSRSLSPVRHYFDTDGEDESGRSHLDLHSPVSTSATSAGDEQIPPLNLGDRLRGRAQFAARFLGLRRPQSADPLAQQPGLAASTQRETPQDELAEDSSGLQAPRTNHTRSFSDTLSIQNLWRSGTASITAERSLPWFLSPTSPTFSSALRAVGSALVEDDEDEDEDGEAGSSDEYEGYGYSDEEDDDDDEFHADERRNGYGVSPGYAVDEDDWDTEDEAESRLGLVLRGHR